MKRTSSLLGWALPAALALGLGALLVSQRQATMQLRGELDAGNLQREELARLQRENARGRAQQISAAQLEALRADHAAVVRLRRELESLPTK